MSYIPPKRYKKRHSCRISHPIGIISDIHVVYTIVITKMKMKNLGILVLIELLLIGVMALSGCIGEEKTGEVEPTTGEPKPEPAIEETKLTTEEKSVVESYCSFISFITKNGYMDYEGCCEKKGEMYKAIKEKGISHCDSIDMADDKNICISFFAMSKKDVSLCDRTSDASEKNMCVAFVAGAKQDVSVCDRTPTTLGKNGCIAFVATAKKDVSLCNRISDALGKYMCVVLVATAKQDVSVCDRTSTVLRRDACIGAVAGVKQDVSLCDEISDAEIKEMCIKGAS